MGGTETLIHQSIVWGPTLKELQLHFFEDEPYGYHPNLPKITLGNGDSGHLFFWSLKRVESGVWEFAGPINIRGQKNHCHGIYTPGLRKGDVYIGEVITSRGYPLDPTDPTGPIEPT